MKAIYRFNEFHQILLRIKRITNINCDQTIQVGLVSANGLTQHLLFSYANGEGKASGASAYELTGFDDAGARF